MDANEIIQITQDSDLTLTRLTTIFDPLRFALLVVLKQIKKQRSKIMIGELASLVGKKKEQIESSIRQLSKYELIQVKKEIYEGKGKANGKAVRMISLTSNFHNLVEKAQKYLKMMQ